MCPYAFSAVVLYLLHPLCSKYIRAFHDWIFPSKRCVEGCRHHVFTVQKLPLPAGNPLETPCIYFWVSCPKHFSVKSLHSWGAAYDGKHEVRRRGSERAILPDYICTSQLILADMRHSRRAGGQMVKWRGGEGETMYECKMFSHFILGLCACDIISERRSSDNVSLRSNNLPTHNQKTNAKYDHRQYERGTRQHPSDALKLQGWIILNGICNITFNFLPSLISNYSISVQLWFIGETEHDSPNKHSAHKSLSFDVLRYVQGRRVKLHLCWEAGREVVCSALIQHISQKAFCSWKRPKTTCFSSLIKERKGCTILFLLHHISNINPILDRDAFTYIPFTFVCCSLYGV